MSRFYYPNDEYIEPDEKEETMGNIMVPIFWKDLTLEAQSKVEKYVKSGSVNVATWTKHYRDGKFPIAYVTLKKKEEGSNGAHN